MKRNFSIVVGLILLAGLVWVLASGRETAVAHNNQQSEIITTASTSATAVDEPVAWH